MICEFNVRLHDKNAGDTSKNKKAGDVISLKTINEIRKKYTELLAKGLLTQDLLDMFTNIKKAVKNIDPEDFLKAKELHWPWSETERKTYLICAADLSEKQIEEIGRPDQELRSGVMVQMRYRKKNLDIDGITSTLDKVKLMDPDVEYQPIKDSELDHSYIKEDRNPNVSS